MLSLKDFQFPGQQQPSRHKFSAFVDDSTVFLERSGQLPRVLDIVREFGRISGLQMQPAKTMRTLEWCGIPVLPPEQTVRYLGYKIGIGDLHQVNWAKRIRSLQRRMATAEQAATSVRDRVDLA
ncbi:Reverse transcriptase domain [Phytophthora cactorum]|nr:Reverse transcriptase domain [Phytophthora cactorum]